MTDPSPPGAGAPHPDPPAPGARWWHDPRLVPVAGVLGAVALAASLISEWQVTTLDASVQPEAGPLRPVTSGVADLGAWGAGYLAGLLLLAAGAALLAAGPAAVRPAARAATLGVGAALLAVLGAAAADLGRGSRALSAVAAVAQLRADQVTLAYGRGVFCALAGTAAVTLAAWLARPDGPARRPRRPVTPDGDGQPLDLEVSGDPPGGRR